MKCLDWRNCSTNINFLKKIRMESQPLLSKNASKQSGIALVVGLLMMAVASTLYSFNAYLEGILRKINHIVI